MSTTAPPYSLISSPCTSTPNFAFFLLKVYENLPFDNDKLLLAPIACHNYDEV